MAPRKGKKEAKDEVQIQLGPQVCCLVMFEIKTGHTQYTENLLYDQEVYLDLTR